MSFTVVNGWAIYTPNAGERTVYVDSSAPDDTADGLTSSTPKKTLAAACALMRDGHGDHLYLKRGQTWTGEKINLRNKSGASASIPMVVSTYGTGARPVIDLNNTAVTPGVDTADSNYIHIDSLSITDNLFVGTGAIPVGIELSGASDSCYVQNCRIHHVSKGISAVQIGGHPSNLTIRRNYIHNCFDIENAQSGVGIIVGECTGSLNLTENVFYHNGWCEGRTMLTTSVASTVGDQVTLDSGSSTNDVYNGCVVNGAGPTNGPFTVTDYVGATKTMTVTPTPDDAFSDLTIDTAPPNLFRHNTYIQNDNEGYVCQRNFSLYASSHGLGRCTGVIAYNLTEGCPFGILGINLGQANSAMNCHDNACINASRDITLTGNGSSVGISNSTDTAGAAVYADNIVANYSQTSSSLGVKGFDLGLSVATTLRGNRVYNIDQANNDGACFRLTPAGNLSHTISGNSAQMVDTQPLIDLRTGTGSPTFSFLNNSYSRSSESNAFQTEAGGLRTWTQWQAQFTEGGSSFSALNLFPFPSRDLGAANAALFGGPNSFGSALARIIDFDKLNEGTASDWTEAQHSALTWLNYIRAGFGMPSLDVSEIPTIGTTLSGRVVQGIRSRRVR